MKRGELIAGLVGAVAFPREIAAQPVERTCMVRALLPGVSSYDMLRGQLAELGFVEGRNLVVDVRVGAPDQLPRMARELVATKPDVGDGGVRSAHRHERCWEQRLHCRVWARPSGARFRPNSLGPWRELDGRGHPGG